MPACSYLSSTATAILIVMSASVYADTASTAFVPGVYPRTMQGPMVGYVTPDTANVWVRLSGPWTTQVRYTDRLEGGDWRLSETVTTTKADDYTAVVPISGLEPDTTYRYELLTQGRPDRYTMNRAPMFFKTAPAEGVPAKFSVAMGSCPRVLDDDEQHIWDDILPWKPDLFFWLGDNVYADTLDPDILAEEYQLQFSLHRVKPVLRNLPNLAIWDDHDFGQNNNDRTNPMAEDALRIFKQYWANPAYGTDDTPGVFFKYDYGGVDFFFLDNRYHRDPNDQPDGPDKTHLGKGQLEWLLDGLKQSDAPFKVLIAGGGWTKTKGPGGDAWSGFMYERNLIFDYIRDEEITGVLLVSGDTHIGELNCIPWSDEGGYDLYEFVSSPLGQLPFNNWVRKDRFTEMRIRLPYSRSNNFGLLSFDLTEDDPICTYQLVAEGGETVWQEFRIRASELRNGVESWHDKISKPAARWNKMNALYEAEQNKDR